ncbi:MAG: hypothetical protein ACE5FF_09040, partial [Saprospiraceae bacterium]
PTEITLRSSVGMRQEGRWRHPLHFTFSIKNDQLHSFMVQGEKIQVTAKQWIKDGKYDSDER